MSNEQRLRQRRAYPIRGRNSPVKRHLLEGHGHIFRHSPYRLPTGREREARGPHRLCWHFLFSLRGTRCHQALPAANKRRSIQSITRLICFVGMSHRKGHPNVAGHARLQSTLYILFPALLIYIATLVTCLPFSAFWCFLSPLLDIQCQSVVYGTAVSYHKQVACIPECYRNCLWYSSLYISSVYPKIVSCSR